MWLLAIITAGTILRCLHLFGDHYPILSADSYYFHAMAERIMSGGDVPVLHSGLAFPLAGLGEVIGLPTATKVLPLILGAASIAAVYFMALRWFDRRVALGAAITWALMPHGVIFSSAGYLDRDAMSVLLFMAGVWLFYVTRRQWLWCSAIVAAVGTVIWLEWSYVGMWLFGVVIGAVGLSLVRRDRNIWRQLALLLVVGVIAAVATGHGPGRLINDITPETSIAELQGLGLVQLVVWYGFWMLPMALGVVVAVHRRSDGDLVGLVWAGSMFLASLFAQRCLIIALPAACILSGLGIAHILQITSGKPVTERAKRAVTAILAVLTIGVVVASGSVATNFGANNVLAPDKEWVAAMDYLRTETPLDARVMNWWDYGYWIDDLAEREPVAAGSPVNMYEVGQAYCATDPDDITAAMEKVGAKYWVLSRDEQRIWGQICRAAGVDEVSYYAPTSSRALYGLYSEFQSDLNVAYRSDNIIILERG